MTGDNPQIDALRGLARLVRAEYPEDHSLAEIAGIWGCGEGVTPDEVEAIRAIEPLLAEGLGCAAGKPA